MYIKVKSLIQLIFVCAMLVILLILIESMLVKGTQHVNSIYQAKSGHLRIVPECTSTSPITPQNQINGNISDEKYYEEELQRLKLSPFVYTSGDGDFKPLDPSQLMQTKTISWFPFTASPKTYKGCPYSNCKNLKQVEPAADLVVFDPIILRDIWIRQRRRNNKYTMKIPEHTNLKQMWAIYTIDPPWWVEHVAEIAPEITARFNLTMSFRRDADMTYYFGRLKKRTLPITKDYGALFDSKTNMAVWVVSHCLTESRRMEYIARMKPILNIDVFGRCGNPSRPGCRIQQDWEKPQKCLPELGKEYKFYIAFENNYCPDYITEKYFKLFWENKIDMIPVLRGPLDHKRYLPRDTYIDAADFQSPEELARYLVDLGNDEERYIKMLRQKDRWTLADADHIHCKMCEMAHTKLNHIGYHPNFLHAFYGGPKNPCVGPTDL